MKQLVVLFSLIFLVGLLRAAHVAAQTEELTPTVTTIEESVDETTEEKNIEDERQALKALYRDQIQAYQNSYRNFSLAKTQFQNLATLASLEEAVLSTREVFSARNIVLITYLDQLFLELTVNPSYDEEIRQEYLNKIKQLRAELVTFNQLVINSQDRQALAERAVGFIPLGTELQAISVQTRKLLFLGKFRSSAGMAQQLTQEIKASHEANPVSALKQGERQRAYQELTSADAVVQTAWDKSVLQYQTEEDFSNQAYTAFIVTLSPLQSGLIRWYTLLEQAAQL
jgi:hypothetical protein